MNYLQLLLIAFALQLCSCKEVKFKECEKGKCMGVASMVEVEPCDKEPCTLKKGTNMTLSITFTPKKDVTAVKAVATVMLGPFHINYPLPNPDGCKHSGLTCPLKNGVTVRYSTPIFVKDMYPSGMKLVLKFELKDQNGVDVVCVEDQAVVGSTFDEEEMHRKWSPGQE